MSAVLVLSGDSETLLLVAAQLRLAKHEFVEGDLIEIIEGSFEDTQQGIQYFRIKVSPGSSTPGISDNPDAKPREYPKWMDDWSE